MMDRLGFFPFNSSGNLEKLNISIATYRYRCRHILEFVEIILKIVEIDISHICVKLLIFVHLLLNVNTSVVA